MTLPALTAIRLTDTHRLIPSQYSSGGDSVLTQLSDDAATLQDIFTLDDLTNDRLLGENNYLPAPRQFELLFGVRYHRIVNAAFCHPHPLGSRFNGPDRGAWYAALQFKTAQREIAFHKALEYRETAWDQDDTGTYDDYLADFSGEFSDIRNDGRFADCLDPASYRESQALAERLLDDNAQGIMYPSVRHKGGTCLACFRPPLVMNVRKDRTYTYTWRAASSRIVWQ